MADSPNTTTASEIPAAKPADKTPNITDMLADVETEICDIRSHAELVRLAGVALFTENDEEVGTAIEQLGHDLRDTAERLNEAYKALFHALFSTEAAHG